MKNFITKLVMVGIASIVLETLKDRIVKNVLQIIGEDQASIIARLVIAMRLALCTVSVTIKGNVLAKLELVDKDVISV
jgi:hypothetical protein